MPGYYFNLPPFNELNPTQNTAVIDNNAIALSGGPGTGKSVVSIYRHILNHTRETPINSQLITFTTSLAYYLAGCCRNQNLNASNKVDSSLNWRTHKAGERAEIIHDEAQDLDLPFNRSLINYSNKISYGADDQQLIRGNSRNNNGTYNLNYCSPEPELRRVFPNNSLHTLARNYRNSRRILQFAKRLLTQAVIPHEIIESCRTQGEYPRLIVKRSNQQADQAILQIVNQFRTNETINIAILVPLENPNHYAGDNATANYYYNLLKNNNIDCSVYTQRMRGSLDIKNIHVTTFKSAKGLEFDVVILPEFHLLNETRLTIVDWRDYYVGITRTKSNLFMISSIDFNLPSEGASKLIDKV